MQNVRFICWNQTPLHNIDVVSVRHLELTAVGDHDRLLGFPTLRANSLHLLDDIQAINHSAKDDVLTVQPRCLPSADEELRSIGVWTGIGHRQRTCSLVLQGEVLILELLSIDALSTSAITLGEVTALTHEPWNNAMKFTSFEAKALFTGAKGSEVLCCLWDNIRTQLHGHFSRGLASDGDIEENLWMSHYYR